MAKRKEHEEALRLRQQGESYSQIKKVLKVSKGTLSLWLRDYPLSKARVRELRDWSEQRIERYRETRRKQREERLAKVYKEQKKIVLPLGKRDLFLAGLFLYWGEGTKYATSALVLANTDPAMIKFYIKWLEKAANVPREKIKVRLQLYKDMDTKEETKYWSEVTSIPVAQFRNPQIKDSDSKRITYKRGFGHGTCDIEVNNVVLGEKVFMGIKAIKDSMGV